MDDIYSIKLSVYLFIFNKFVKIWQNRIVAVVRFMRMELTFCEKLFFFFFFTLLAVKANNVSTQFSTKSRSFGSLTSQRHNQFYKNEKPQKSSAIVSRHGYRDNE